MTIERSEIQRYFNYGTIGWIVLIFILSNIPSSGVSNVGFFENIQVDKFVHLFLYMILTIAVLSTHRLNKWKISRYLLASLCLCYGILMEAFQYMLNLGRHFDYYDIFANLTGIIIGFFIFEKLLKSLSLWKSH